MDSHKSASTRDEPWRQLPVAVADVLEPELPALTGEILAAIAREVPEYARPLEGSFGRGIRVGVTEALRQFVALVRSPDSGREPGREVYVGLGRGELRQGRSLDSLQAAYRVGARVAWRHAARAGRDAGLEPDVLYRLAEAMFAYIDELSAESVEGYAAEQSAREGERELRRRRLLAALTEHAPLEPDELRSRAAEADWPLPESLAAIGCDREQLPGIARRLGPEALAARIAGVGCVAVPDPDGPGRREQIAVACRDRGATIGPVTDLDGFAHSWQEARDALAALAAGTVAAEGGDGPFDADAHAVELLLAAGSARLERVARRRLAPLAGLGPRGRENLLATLSTLLREQGNVTRVAAALDVHPQTVRYRAGRLRELLGGQLDDPDARFEIEAALRAGADRSLRPA